MTVRELIKDLKKLDQDAEVVGWDSENGFFFPVRRFAKYVNEQDNWINIEESPRPRPTKFVWLG